MPLRNLARSTRASHWPHLKGILKEVNWAHKKRAMQSPHMRCGGPVLSSESFHVEHTSAPQVMHSSWRPLSSGTSTRGKIRQSGTVRDVGPRVSPSSNVTVASPFAILSRTARADLQT